MQNRARFAAKSAYEPNHFGAIAPNFLQRNREFPAMNRETSERIRETPRHGDTKDTSKWISLAGVFAPSQTSPFKASTAGLCAIRCGERTSNGGVERIQHEDARGAAVQIGIIRRR